jgi:hypothetical protein
MLILEGSGRKPVPRYDTTNARETKKNHENGPGGRHLQAESKPVHPEYEAGLLPTQP